MVEDGRHFIAFGKSRRNVEVILKETRDKLDSADFSDNGNSGKIAGYRGGYTPLERKEIERKMLSGELSGLVSTNALELGIDIGKLDSTVLAGYPGTRASFWQQTGRAGRSGEKCINYLILDNQPFDQYIAIDPEWLFSMQSENAIVDPDNLLIELSHVRAAAAEMPLTMDDIGLFPDLGEIIPVLLKAEELKSLSGRFAWAGPKFPAGDYSLRNMDKTRFKLILDEEKVSPKEIGAAVPMCPVITEMDESQAYHELHPGAVYMHGGALYEVLRLDLKSRTAYAVPFSGNYYTVPAGSMDTTILQVFEEMHFGRTQIHFGDININEIIYMFKKLQFHNHQNLGYVELPQPLQKDYDTESTWIDIPENVIEVYHSLLLPAANGELVLNNHFEGISHAIKNAAMMVTMTERDDIDAVISGGVVHMDEERADHEQVSGNAFRQQVSLYIYDRYEGGLGYSEKIYELVPRIIENAIRMVSGCTCENGCPACVGDYSLDKKMVLWGLKNLREESEPPRYCGKYEEKTRPVIRREYTFSKLQEQWPLFCESADQNGESGAAFLQTVKHVEIKGHSLVLTVEHVFYQNWIQEPENKRMLESILRRYVECPAEMKVEVLVEEDLEKAKKAKGKLQRRYLKDRR